MRSVTVANVIVSSRRACAAAGDTACLPDSEVVETMREDLDVPRLVEGLGREEAFARLVGGAVDQPRGRCEGAALVRMAERDLADSDD